MAEKAETSKGRKKGYRSPKELEVVVNYVTSPKEASVRLTKALYQVYLQQEEEKLRKQMEGSA